MPSEQLKQTVLASDDQGFCDLILSMVVVGEDFDESSQILYQRWVLERLETMRRQNSGVFFGSFLGPLRRRFPGHIFVGDLFAAMGHTVWESSGAGGDLGPDAFLQAIMDFYDKGGEPGTYPGWYSVKEHYTVRRGEFTVMTGIASHMKSQFTQALCINLARDAGWKIGIFSPEHYPAGNLGRSLIECYAGMAMAAMDREQLLAGATWINKHFFPIVPPEEVPPTLPWILGVARQQVVTYGLQGVVIDPWNEVDHHLGGRQSETQYISEALSLVRRFARHQNVHVWLVAHPRKMQKAQGGEYAGKYPPPTPYDISDSAHWYNKADNCLCVWRDVWEDSPKIELHVSKVRNRSIGKPGLVHLTYTGYRFVE